MTKSPEILARLNVTATDGKGVGITITSSCDCPICGAKEVEDDTLPIDQWQRNVRAHKVTDARGLSWSECRLCKEMDGNGWFAFEGEDVVVEPARIAALEARGEMVEQI